MTHHFSDRVPSMEKLIRPDDLNTCFTRFLGAGLRSVMVFDVEGVFFTGVASDGAETDADWELVPAEALVAEREGNARFFVGDQPYQRYALYAGADRVGTVAFSWFEDASVEVVDILITGIVQMLGTLLQSGFATWVTSELHRAASEESYRALEVQNLELNRAVAHLRELDQMKSNFLATVSHELRTPLTSVIGFADMLIKEIAGPLNDEQRDYAGTILERGEDLYALIAQILDLSRIEVGELPLDIEVLDIVEVVQRAVRSVELLAKRGKIELQIETADVRAVHGDAKRLHQVLVNLLANAIKFQEEPGIVRVTVSEAPRRRPSDESFFGVDARDAVRIAVTDEGPGLTPEQCERVFDAFYQVDSTSTRSHGGAGLGLSIVYRLVHAHGGDVWAESVLGEGATFQFTVPLVVHPDGSSATDLPT